MIYKFSTLLFLLFSISSFTFANTNEPESSDILVSFSKITRYSNGDYYVTLEINNNTSTDYTDLNIGIYCANNSKTGIDQNTLSGKIVIKETVKARTSLTQSSLVHLDCGEEQSLVSVIFPNTQFNNADLNNLKSSSYSYSLGNPYNLIPLYSFERNCKATLKWEISNAKQIKHFEIEGSLDSKEFELVETVRKNSLDKKAYSFFDNTERSQYFYRLKVIHLDGTFRYSETVVISTTCNVDPFASILFPNPVDYGDGMISIKFYSDDDFAKLQLKNLVGLNKTVLSTYVEKGWNTARIDISNLPTGHYFLVNTNAAGKRRSTKFVIQ